MNMDILGPQRKGMLTSDQGLVGLPRREVHLGLGQPGIETGCIERNGLSELEQGGWLITQR